MNAASLRNSLECSGQGSTVRDGGRTVGDTGSSRGGQFSNVKTGPRAYFSTVRSLWSLTNTQTPSKKQLAAREATLVREDWSSLIASASEWPVWPVCGPIGERGEIRPVARNQPRQEPLLLCNIV